MDAAASESLHYPPDLAAHTLERWSGVHAKAEGLPGLRELSELMGHAFYASCLSEEGRAVRCRIILAEPEDFENQEGPPVGFHILAFDPPKPLTPHEIGKIAFAAHYYRSLIAVRLTPAGSFEVWGMVDSGPRWVSKTDGGRTEGTPLPVRLVVEVLAPGEISAACGYRRVAQLKGGRIAQDGMDPFRSQWLPDMFQPFRCEILRRFEGEGIQGAAVDEQFIGLLSQNVIRRTLSLVRNARHGGMLVILPPDSTAFAPESGILRIGYPFESAPARARYSRLMLTAVRELALAGSKRGLERVNWAEYQQFSEDGLANVDEAIFEMAHLFADLMSVDGALLLSQRFDLIGFGVEITASAAVECVYAALDLEATQSRRESVNLAGTRHRAAYRLCCTCRQALATVISQDGGVRFVRNFNGRITYWDYTA